METLTVYEKAPTTSRSAEELARRHGFEGVAHLAEVLPTEARVLDVGAGASPFGKEVAILRPDISWVNFDYSYRDSAILEEASTGAPSNVDYIAGDATELGDVYGAEEFDAVFSYWLLAHLSLEDAEPARIVAASMYDLAKTGGLISAGPKTNRRLPVSLKPRRAIQAVKTEDLGTERYSEVIVEKTRLCKIAGYVQTLANESITPALGTSRHAKREGRAPRIYHPESDSYVSPFTRKGAQSVGIVTVAMARQVRRTVKSV